MCDRMLFGLGLLMVTYGIILYIAKTGRLIAYQEADSWLDIIVRNLMVIIGIFLLTIHFK